MVGEYSPWRKRAAVLLAALLVVACGWGGYEYGRYAGGFDVRDARARERELQQRIDELVQDNRRLKAEHTTATRGAEIDKSAAESVRASLAQTQQELLESREELAFYRSIVAPGEVAPGLHIQRFRLTPGESQGYFGYELVLTQAMNKRRSISGSADLRVIGQLDGKQVTYALSDLADADLNKLNFKFKYFQSFEGSLRLPSTFDPQSVTIVVRPSGKKAKAVRESYKWSEVISGGS